MELLELIDMDAYIPQIAPNGLYSRKNPMLYKGERIKSPDLMDILSLLNSELSGKKTSYISNQIIRVDMDKEEIMSYLPKSDIKMIEVYGEVSYNTYMEDDKKAKGTKKATVKSKGKKSKTSYDGVNDVQYKKVFKETKSYIFWSFDEYTDYAVLLYLIKSGMIKDMKIGKELENINMDILEGICYGYPKEYIGGYYVTRASPRDTLNLYGCIQGRNITKEEKKLLFQELNDFMSSPKYTQKLNEFEDNYAMTVNKMEKIFDTTEFDRAVENVNQIVRVCAPDYTVS